MLRSNANLVACWMLNLLLCFTRDAWAAPQVDPADITPLADLLGWLLAVPVSRLCAVGCAVRACFALTRGHGGRALLYVGLTGVVLAAPAIVKTVLTHVLRA
jgi:type IV secretory pathway VirB2 component (pilin)